MVDQPVTFEDAVERQRAVHARIDAGEQISERTWRSHSLREGYEVRQVPDYGMGYFEVNVETGEVCEWNGKWSDDGAVLLCQDCFSDGT